MGQVGRHRSVIATSSPKELFEVMHQACEETPVYRGKTNLESCFNGLFGFDCYSVKVNGELAGGIIFRGNEGHIAIIQKFRKSWADRGFYRFMQEQVKQRGVIHANCGNPESLPFIQRLVDRGYLCLVNS